MSFQQLQSASVAVQQKQIDNILGMRQIVMLPSNEKEGNKKFSAFDGFIQVPRKNIIDDISNILGKRKQ